ncbi:hypothetical protein MMC29_001357 [Sticta canariensis]|nr:hypothetical protein [Sticta canariensis]
MDVGVGSFVFSGALVHGRGTGRAGSHKAIWPLLGLGRRQSLPFNTAPPSSMVLTSPALPNSSKLLMLQERQSHAAGVLRMLVTTASGYHVDAEEYGVHWNFFFTLAATAALSALTADLDGRTCCLAGTPEPFLLSAFFSYSVASRHFPPGQRLALTQPKHSSTAGRVHYALPAERAPQLAHWHASLAQGA